jgi:hypothetical protein
MSKLSNKVIVFYIEIHLKGSILILFDNAVYSISIFSAFSLNFFKVRLKIGGVV